MIQYKKCENDAELEGILKLQQSNLKINLSEDQKQAQGFVTVEHSFDLLKKLNQHENHIIAKVGEEVIAYVLAMNKETRSEVPILLDMFELFDQLIYKAQVISDYNYIVIGQVCVDLNYRGQGVFEKIYNFYKEQYRCKYSFGITEIASVNTRSLKAHKKLGFEEIHRYVDDLQVEWVVVIWDWDK